MPDVLSVSALQIGNPIIVLIFVKSGNFSQRQVVLAPAFDTNSQVV
jgi:hypothetical protein